MTLFAKKNLIKIIIAILALSLVIFSFVYFPSAQMINANDFGVVSFVASLPDNSDKQAMVNKTVKAGFGWVREEYTYSNPMNYVPGDVAYDKITEANLKILGLLIYPGPDKSHEVWKGYVTEIVSRYPAVAAWEVMNEADNYLSAADYTVYLKEASEIIRAKSKARIICTGITARVGVNQFWDGIAAAGGWDSFDGVTLHIYHFGDPYQDTNNNGTFAQEIQKAVASIKQNGGGKTIWATEFGYDSNDYGEANQAKWLVESLSIMKAMPEVERGFLFRLYEHDNGLGLLNAKFEEKEAFSAVQDWLAQGAPATKESLISVEKAFETAPPKSKVDTTKSAVRLDGENISPDGQEQFRVVVAIKDSDGKTIIDQKPSLIVGGEKTIPTDFTLVGEEWFAYVASSEAGEKTAQVKVAETELSAVEMVFGETDTQSASEVPPVTISQPVITTESVTTSASTKHSKSGFLWFIGIETLITFLILLVIFKLIKRLRAAA